MESYERRMNLIRSGEMGLAEQLGGYDPNADMATHSKGLKRAPVETDSYLSKAQLQALREVQMQREQVRWRTV